MFDVNTEKPVLKNRSEINVHTICMHEELFLCA